MGILDYSDFPVGKVYGPGVRRIDPIFPIVNPGEKTKEDKKQQDNKKDETFQDILKKKITGIDMYAVARDMKDIANRLDEESNYKKAAIVDNILEMWSEL